MKAKPLRILIQTTIPFTEDDWHVGRFAKLVGRLSPSRIKPSSATLHATPQAALSRAPAR